MSESRNARKKALRRSTREARQQARRRRIMVGAAASVLVLGVVLGVVGVRNRLIEERMGQLLIAVDPVFAAGNPELLQVHRTVIGTSAQLTDVATDELPHMFPVADLVLADGGTPLAWDPLVLVVDQRRARPDERATLEDLLGALAEVSLPPPAPGQARDGSLVVAGDDDRILAGLVLYLTGELLGDVAYRDLYRLLSENAAPDPEASDRWMERLQPVVDQLSRWQADGILAENWINVDPASLANQLGSQQQQARYGGFVTLRSRLAGLSFEERFHLRVMPLPTAARSTTRRAVGVVAGLRQGDGPRSTDAAVAAELWMTPDVQESIERNTPWSPIMLQRAPLNREHRDLVRHYRVATTVADLSRISAQHPLLRSLRRQLQELQG